MVESQGQRKLREALAQTTTPEQVAKKPEEPAKPGTDIVPLEFLSKFNRRNALEQTFGLPAGSDTGTPYKPTEVPKAEGQAATQPEPARPKAEVAPKLDFSGIDTQGLDEKHVKAFAQVGADAKVISDVEKEFGISISRKATREVLDAEKVAAAADKIESGEALDKKLKLTKKERQADIALESLLNNRDHMNASAATADLGLAKDEVADLRSQLGDKLYKDDLKSGGLVDRQKRIIETILEKSNY